MEPESNTATLEQPTTPTTSAPVQPADWRSFVSDELKADPVVAKWSEKASEKDIPSLIKSYAHLNSRMGSAINLPGKDAKPEDVQALRSKLYEAGIFQAPPADPKEYGLVKPEHLPEGMQWSDELSGKFASALHKHGVPKAALADLMPLYMEAMGGATQTLKIDRDQAMATIKAEHGEQYDSRVEMVKRMMSGIVQTPEELQWAESVGLADHPRFLSMMLRLAPLAMQDSSFIASLPRQGGEKTGESVKEELNKIMTDATHPMHAGWNRQDKAVMAHIDELYKSAYGNEKVKIGEGVKA